MSCLLEWHLRAGVSCVSALRGRGSYFVGLSNFHECEGVMEAFDCPGQDSAGDRSCVGIPDLVELVGGSGQGGDVLDIVQALVYVK